MARLGNHTAEKAAPAKWHDPVAWRYSAGTIDGDPVLQIETARKSDQSFSGEFAQVIQIDKSHAVELYALLKRAFDLKS